MTRSSECRATTRRRFLTLAARVTAWGLVLPWLPGVSWEQRQRLSLREASFYRRGGGSPGPS
jgi:hypothetical protein